MTVTALSPFIKKLLISNRFLPLLKEKLINRSDLTGFQNLEGLFLLAESFLLSKNIASAKATVLLLCKYPLEN